MAEVSTKPYLIRAIYEWCTDSGFTPYVAVVADDDVRVPREFVKNGEIVLNVSALAANHLALENDAISFQARFGGVARDVYVPIDKVIAVYARENGQGMAFEVPRNVAPAGAQSPLAVVKPTAAPLGLVAVHRRDDSEQDSSASVDAEDPTPPTPPRAGDRPHLTRVK